ncbi:unnamed protein product [Pelagomonas calceolata]|uniref:Uncharacterized protein n=1 Tax=Pelagomonas calceolata TaxID=35677 RepID=A0A8J2SB84_9STRA|nr:unnamed protein product [Pelagomonas calceolata]
MYCERYYRKCLGELVDEPRDEVLLGDLIVVSLQERARRPLGGRRLDHVDVAQAVVAGEALHVARRAVRDIAHNLGLAALQGEIRRAPLAPPDEGLELLALALGDDNNRLRFLSWHNRSSQATKLCHLPPALVREERGGHGLSFEGELGALHGHAHDAVPLLHNPVLGNEGRGQRAQQRTPHESHPVSNRRRRTGRIDTYAARRGDTQANPGSSRS